MKQSIHGLVARIREIETHLVNCGVAALEDKNHEASIELRWALSKCATILGHSPINPEIVRLKREADKVKRDFLKEAQPEDLEIKIYETLEEVKPSPEQKPAPEH